MPDLEIQRELEKSRKNLLELTTRNRLLSIPSQSRAKLVRIVDEHSTEIHRLLVTERRKLSFLPSGEDRDAPLEGETGEDWSSMPQPEDEGLAAGKPAERHLDRQLQTLLPPKALQTRLLSMHTDARAYIEDQGVNILYLAMGQLKWFEDEASDVERFAPLLLLPVRLERSSAVSKFKVEALEEDLSDNLTLNARLQEFGIKLPALDDDEEFSPGDYFAAVRESVRGMDRWEVFPDAMVLGFFSFSKFLMYRDLDPRNWPEATPISHHELVRPLLRDGFAGPAESLDGSQHLDALIPVERLNHVVDSDSSQALVIEEVRRGRNLVIQGPPGTGKSQTITNLIATAVLDGKTVLFVAEKMAALEVVRRRLEHQGLDPLAIELHSHKTSKKAFLEELDRTLGLGRPKAEGIEDSFLRLRDLREQLNGHACRLNERLEPCGLTPVEIMGELLLLDLHPSSAPAVPIAAAHQWSPGERLERERLVEDLLKRLKELGPVQAHAWAGARIEHQTRFQLEEIIQEARDCLALLGSFVAATAELGTAIGRAPPADQAEGNRLMWIAERVREAPKHDRDRIKDDVWAEQLNDLRALTGSGALFQSIAARVGRLVVDAAWSTDLAASRRSIAAHGDSLFRLLNGEYRAGVATLRSVLRDPQSLPRGSRLRLELIDALTEGQKCLRAIREGEAAGERAFGASWRGVDSDWAELKTLTDWISALGDERTAAEVRIALSEVEDAKALDGPLQRLREAGAAFTASLAGLFNRLNLDLVRSFGQAEADRVPLSDLRTRLLQWTQGPEDLAAWIGYWSQSQLARSSGLAAVVERTESGALALADGTVAFRRGCFRRLYEHATERFPQLRKFDGDSHSRLMEEFRRQDQERITIARYEALAAHHHRLPRLDGAMGALGIVMGEIAKKRRHMSIRRLIASAGSAVQAIKPVFMMSPLSVAQFLEPGKIGFDLVIFDEASQVTPVDALGAIARGRQLVVVGDSRQLPPSSFFSRLDGEGGEEEDDDPMAAAGDMESILTLAAARGLPTRMLRWHYRSRHSSLIAVSNFEFYANSLFIIPSPLSEHPDYGLKFHHVRGGVYRRGSRHQSNRMEAKAVAEAVMEHAQSHAALSLGVAAFSVSQRDAILAELELLRRNKPEREGFFTAAHPHEPFFVKNLENVQGDERDVILISVGYGRDEDGSFAMNFGPINKEGGERRLNVLISRSKMRCEVFASITADDLDLSRSTQRGVVALKSFLHYAQAGILGSGEEPGGRKAVPPFEEAVRRAIEDEGLTVHPRVGIAGFFVDLAVVDPDQPGRYLLGIECDGESYASARSARERDRQRQAVLEAHGWTIHRIWSADWFLRPREQLARVLRAIEAARKRGGLRASDRGLEAKDAPSRSPVEITREEVPPGDRADARLAETYREASLNVPAVDIHEVRTERLAGLLVEVVSIEGPIHEEELVTRIRENWGVGRAGPRIREAIDRALAQATHFRQVTIEEGFVSLPGQEVKIRDRSGTVSATLRRFERIPPAETAAAVLRLAEVHHGVSREEIAGGVARLMGLQRTTHDFESGVAGVIDRLLRDRRLHEVNGLLRATSGQAGGG